MKNLRKSLKDCTGRYYFKRKYMNTYCEEQTHQKRPWCWERLKEGEGDDRGCDGWMVLLTQWAWVWASSWREWTGNPDVLQSMRLQRVGHNWATEQLEQIWIFKLCVFIFLKSVFWRPSRRILSYTPSCYSKYEKLPAPISRFNEVLLCWWLFIFLSSLCCCELTLSKYWISIQPHS